TGAGNDGTANGILAVTVSGANVANASFGIQQPPTAGSGTQAAANLGSTNQVTVNPTTFTNTTNSSDPSPGGVTGIRITAIPTGATTIVINGTTYGPGFTAFPGGGVVVPTDASGQPTQTITVDPTAAGVGTVTISFRAIDAAGTESSNTGTAVITLSSVTINGTVFNDANGLLGSPANTIDGTPVNGTDIDPTTAGAQILYASLVQGATIIATVPVNSSGVYTFADVPTGSYNVVLTTNVSGSLTPSLPSAGSGWVSTGEFLGTGAGNDGTANGILVVTVSGANVANASFGIQQPPTAVNDNGTGALGNPIVVNVTGNDTDATPGVVDATRVSLVTPGGATGVQTDGQGDVTGFTVPGEGTWSVNITSGAVTFTPQAGFIGNPTVVSYTVRDNGGAISNTATITVTYPTVTVSGTVVNDANNSNTIQDGSDGGTNTGGTLFAYLVNGANVVVGKATVAANGTYSLNASPSTTYTIELSTDGAVAIGTNVVTSPISNTPPTGWVTTGEGTNNTDDGTPDGVLSITTGAIAVSGVNFGIQQPPTAGSGSNTASNTGGTNQIAVPANTFTNITASSDVAPGTVTSIRITAIPTGATTIVINGTTYGPGFTAFPGGGVVVPTDANGNPTQIITVDPTLDVATTVTISFVAIDNAGFESANTGTAVLNFGAAGFTVSGIVRNDPDGLFDNEVDGPGTNTGGLNAVLVNSGGNVAQVAMVQSDGTYSFSVVPDGTYTILLTTASPAVSSVAPGAASLRAGWVTSGEFLGTGVGSDGTPNSILAVTVAGANVTNAQFGLQQGITLRLKVLLQGALLGNNVANRSIMRDNLRVSP
ncbi:MAG: hypothetical protein EAY75_01250, partial [Bacteroidetes bacterium]